MSLESGNDLWRTNKTKSERRPRNRYNRVSITSRFFVSIQQLEVLFSRLGLVLVGQSPDLVSIGAEMFSEEVLFGLISCCSTLLLGLLQPPDNDVGDGLVDGDGPTVRAAIQPNGSNG
jgi:hypothetical protein